MVEQKNCWNINDEQLKRAELEGLIWQLCSDWKKYQRINLSPSPSECVKEQGFALIFKTRRIDRNSTQLSRKQEKNSQGRAAEHLIWSLLEMTWPPPLPDRIDFPDLILFLHLLWYCPLWYVHATGSISNLNKS